MERAFLYQGYETFLKVGANLPTCYKVEFSTFFRPTRTMFLNQCGGGSVGSHDSPFIYVATA